MDSQDLRTNGEPVRHKWRVVVLASIWITRVESDPHNLWSPIVVLDISRPTGLCHLVKVVIDQLTSNSSNSNTMLFQVRVIFEQVVYQSVNSLVKSFGTAVVALTRV